MNSPLEGRKVRLRGLEPEVQGSSRGPGADRQRTHRCVGRRTRPGRRVRAGGLRDVVAAVSTAWDEAGGTTHGSHRPPSLLRSRSRRRKGTKGTELDSVAQTPYLRRGAAWTTGVDSVGTSCGVHTRSVGTWTGWGQPGFPTDVLHTGGRARRWLRERRMRRAAGEMYTFPHPLLLLLICISL